MTVAKFSCDVLKRQRIIKNYAKKINETESIPEKVLQSFKILGLIWDELKGVFIFDFAKLANTASKQKLTK